MNRPASLREIHSFWLYPTVLAVTLCESAQGRRKGGYHVRHQRSTRGGFEALGRTPVGRRSVMGRMAALSAAPAVLGFAGSAFAATDDSHVNARSVRYALRGGKVLDGYFASPRGQANLGVVVVMPDQLVCRCQGAGNRSPLCRMPAIWRSRPISARPSRAATATRWSPQMMKTVPDLKRLSHSNSKVAKISVVAA